MYKFFIFDFNDLHVARKAASYMCTQGNNYGRVEVYIGLTKYVMYSCPKLEPGR